MSAIHVIGAGAIGSFLAVSLTQAGQAVSLIARGARAEHVRASGLDFKRNGRQSNVRVPVATECAGLSTPEAVILCTKHQDLASALDMIETYRPIPGIIMTVQNGVEAPDQVADRFPEATVLAARVHGFFELEKALVRHVGVEPSFHFGVWSKPDVGCAEWMAECLTAAGISNCISPDIQGEVWTKFLLASAIGGAGTALARPAGLILQDPLGRELLTAAMREIAALAAARGILLPDGCVEAALDLVATFPREATSSLQRDLEAGRPSEFDHLTGAVLRMAREVSLQTPVHVRLAEMISERGLMKRTEQSKPEREKLW